MKEKVILAYSGGLDTTAIIPWLKENFDYEVKEIIDVIDEKPVIVSPVVVLQLLMLTTCVCSNRGIDDKSIHLRYK